jgi:4-amino-4-deoxy-L-arabinose transferase-like glycosyltransferase
MQLIDSLERRPWVAVGFIVALALILFVPFAGAVHLFDWDEINFAEASREMVVTGEYGRVYINYLPFWEKPPLFFWLQSLAYHAFGVGEFGARFPNAVCGAFTLATLYLLGKKAGEVRRGVLWVGLYIGSLLPHFYFRSGLIDPWFNLFMLLSYWFIIKHSWKLFAGEKGLKQMLVAGLFAGLAVITKGPAALLILGGSVGAYTVAKAIREKRISALPWSWTGVFVYVLAVVGVSCAWLGAELAARGPWFVEQFLTYNVRLFATPDAGHGGFPGYHVVVLAVGCFPASLFFIYSFAKRNKLPLLEGENMQQVEIRHWMRALFWVVLVLFSIVQSKIVHYSSMCYFPLTYLGAEAIERMLPGRRLTVKTHIPGWIMVSIGVLGSVLGGLCISLPYLIKHPELLRGLLAKDPFAVANLDAGAQIHFQGWEAWVGVFVLVVAAGTIWQFAKGQLGKGLQILLPGMGLSIVLILWGFIGRIEWFSQGAAIEWLEERQGEACYILPVGYRSYAPFFYSRIPATTAPPLRLQEPKELIPTRWRDSLLTLPIGEPKFPVYVISKITQRKECAKYPLLEETGAKNGFVFYKKK